MSHLYLHIPFCKQACHYCDFHFSTTQKNRMEMVRAMMKELELRKKELPGNELRTVYFGGGTPSQLSTDELEFIFGEIAKHFTIAAGAEITLEANPDDLSDDFLFALKSTPVNRLSIGIQSFRDEDLRLMNRAHSAAEAESAVRRAQEAGFTNLTVDLIYGLPGLDEASWIAHLEKVNALGVQHLSCYCLTVEPKTALAKFVQAGKVQAVNDEMASRHFHALLRFAEMHGFEQYEISNFAKAGFTAKHNSSYWFGEPYLGIGPSAHSFDGKMRRWNISNNPRYIELIRKGETTFEEELLTEQQRYNEFVMTGLRTKWGISISDVREKFGEGYVSALLVNAAQWLASGDLLRSGDVFVLSAKGKLLADRIASDLFVV